MILIVTSLTLFLLSGIASAVCTFSGKKQWGSPVGAWGAACAAFVGCIPAVQVLAGRPIAPLMHHWPIFMGSFCIKLDMLSAFFLLVILIVTAFTSVYGLGYSAGSGGTGFKKMAWFFFNMLGASMALVCVAGNAVVFLLAWESMALSSFFLVAFDYEKAVARKAAWIYMTATYLGTACLLPMFLLLGSSAGGMDFSLFGTQVHAGVADACFVLALIGFGTKAGIMPFHVWLPDAHPAAPTHVSALMSGVMIKTGIYGLLRCMTFFGPPHAWWGAALLIVGAVSGVLGILFALAQHDLKRMLAYSSVENIGIIVMGLGIGTIGLYGNAPLVALLGFAGALLHVVNHALFKSLLFMGAGAVYRKTNTREMDLLGGVLKKMPITGAAFLIGAIAISGLPPLNGFVGEFLLYAASFFGIARQKLAITVPLAAAVAALALIGGFAAACFAKTFGIVFLGHPRSQVNLAAGEVGWLMRAPMMVCAGLCCIIGFFGPIFAGKAAAVALSLFNLSAPPEYSSVGTVLFKVCGALWLAALVMSALYLLRNALLKKRSVNAGPTWDCGYTAASSTIQYTSSSFAQPIIDLFSRVLKTEKTVNAPAGYFPAEDRFSSATPDAGNERLYRPVFASITAVLARFNVLQRGRIQTYLLYIVLALVFLLVWRLR